jgi:hypothetical protein
MDYYHPLFHLDFLVMDLLVDYFLYLLLVMDLHLLLLNHHLLQLHLEFQIHHHHQKKL